MCVSRRLIWPLFGASLIFSPDFVWKLNGKHDWKVLAEFEQIVFVQCVYCGPLLRHSLSWFFYAIIFYGSQCVSSKIPLTMIHFCYFLKCFISVLLPLLLASPLSKYFAVWRHTVVASFRALFRPNQSVLFYSLYVVTFSAHLSEDAYPLF